MSKADKIFEKLGYSNDNQTSADVIEYEKPSEETCNETYMIFLDLINRTFCKTKYDWENDKGYPSEITLQELQAINEKCKELEWL